MAYPGNLYALVARDQHVKSRTTVVLTVDSLTNDNILTSKTKTSSTRGKHRSTRANVKRTPNDDYDTAGRKKTLLLYPAVSRAREFRITRVSSNQAPVGAKAWRIDPSEYGQRMDTNSICELRDAFRTHTGVFLESTLGEKEYNAPRKVQARENKLASKLYAEALSVRRRHLRKHAIWLMNGVTQPPSGSSSVQTKPFGTGDVCGAATSSQRPDTSIPNVNALVLQVATSIEGVRRVESYSAGQAEHLGISVMPKNPFRDAMARRVRAKEARRTNSTSSSGVLADRSKVNLQREVKNLTRPRAVTQKSSLLRYTARWHEIAMLHRVFETGSNRRPAKETLHRVGQAMKDTACENPSPGCLTRAQFVFTLFSTLESCHLAALHRLYSTFDLDGTNRVRYVDVWACLLVTHKPDTESLLEGLQQTFLGNLGAISRELQAELTKGNRQVAWRFLRRLFQLYDKAGNGLGLTVDKTERIFQLCATCDDDVLQMSSIATTYTRDYLPMPTSNIEKILTAGMFDRNFCMAWPLLDLFNVQMTSCQAIVKRAMLAK